MEVIDIVNSEKDKDKIIQSLIYILTSYNQKKAINLIKTCIQKDITKNIIGSYFFLFIIKIICKILDNIEDTISGKTFKFYCEMICNRYINNLLQPIYEEFNEIKEELKPNSDRLLDNTQKILSIILKSLTSLPEYVNNLLNFFKNF